MRILIVLILVVFTKGEAAAQYDYEPIFHNLSGEDLYNKLKIEFKPDTVIDYAFARDTMFLNIDAIDRQLSCIYTGLTLPIPIGSDPTQAVFLNGASNGINTEHTYPLSLGTDNIDAESDMHHLFPSKVKTNADRGNLPFGESVDANTRRWYLRETELTSRPVISIDEYSELGVGAFEPRESVKGDIARAMMYIYTIYRNEVRGVNSTFFENQLSTLCIWHSQDPVDEKEWKRNKAIAKYQGNENPFVLDCTLSSRLYCGNGVSSGCKLVDVKSNEEEKLNISIIENQIRLEGVSNSKIYISDLLGRTIYAAQSTNNEYEISLINLFYHTGLHFIQVIKNNKRKVFKVSLF